MLNEIILDEMLPDILIEILTFDEVQEDPS